MIAYWDSNSLQTTSGTDIYGPSIVKDAAQIFGNLVLFQKVLYSYHHLSLQETKNEVLLPHLGLELPGAQFSGLIESKSVNSAMWAMKLCPDYNLFPIVETSPDSR